MGLRAQIHREGPRVTIGVVLPPAHDLRGQRRRGPGVHDVGIAREAARPATLILGVSGRDSRGRVHRQCGLAGQDGGVVAGGAILVERVPERERDPEEALAADQPVPVEAADPVVVPGLHVRRVPAQLGAAPQQRILVSERVDEPLPAGHDLERFVALLVKLHRPDGSARLTVQVAGLLQYRRHALTGGEHGGPGQLLVRRAPVRAVQAAGRVSQDAPVTPDDGPGRQLQLAPPLDVGEVAERAAHGDTRAASPVRRPDGPGSERRPRIPGR